MESQKVFKLLEVIEKFMQAYHSKTKIHNVVRLHKKS